MLWIGTKIGKNYAWELSSFHWYREFDDGIDFLTFEMQIDWFKGDHNPRFHIMFVIMNFNIFDFEIHNINHLIR